MKRKIIPQEDIDNIISRYRRGQSIKFISFAVSRDTGTVRSILIKAGVTINPAKPPPEIEIQWLGITKKRRAV